MNRRAALPVLLWLAALLACAAVIANSRFAADMSAFLPQAPTAQERVLVNQLRDGLISRLILIGIDGADADARAALSKALAERLRADPAFAAVENGEPVNAERDERLLLRYRYVLTHTTASEFSVADLHRAIADSIDRLASPMGQNLKSLLPSDPTGAFLSLLQNLAPGNGPERAQGVWVAHGAARALLLVQTRAQGTDTDALQAALAAIRADFAAAQRQTGGSAREATLVMSGAGVFAVQSRALIERAATRVSLIGAVLIVGLLLLVYRSPLALALGLLPVLSGVLAGIAAVSLGFGVVQGITLGFGTTLMGEAVDYAIYLFVQSAQPAQLDRNAWRHGFWPTIRLGMLTSVFGFATLLLSGFPGLAQLGLYSIAGLVAAALVTRFVLPQLLPARLSMRDLAPFGQRLAARLPALRRLRWLLGVAVLLAAGVLVAHRHAMWNTRLSALSPVSPAALALDAQLRRQLGAPDSGDLVAVEGSSADAALAAAESLRPRLQGLVARGVIAGFDSPAHYLPSAATQRSRLAALPDADVLRSRLEQAVVGLPVKAALFAPFVRDVQAARAQGLLTREQIAHTSFAMALDGMLLREPDGRWLAMLPLHARAHASIDGAQVHAALAGTQATYINLGRISSSLYDGYLHTAAWLSLAGLISIAVLLLLALRSARRTLRILAPLLGAVVVVGAGLLLAGRQLTLLHLIGLMLIVAVGSNYALFFDQGAQSGGIAPRTLASLLLANLTTVFGFGPLALSGVPVLQALGMTVGPGVLLALLFSAMLSAPPNATPPHRAPA